MGKNKVLSLVSIFALLGGIILIYFGFSYARHGQVWLKPGEPSSRLFLSEFKLQIQEDQKDPESYLLLVDEMGQISNAAEINRTIHAPVNIIGVEGLAPENNSASNNHIASENNQNEKAGSQKQIHLNLKSSMFDQDLTLTMPGQEEQQMGPVLFRLSTATENSTPFTSDKGAKKTEAKAQNKSDAKSVLAVRNATTDVLIREIPLNEILQSDVTIDGVSIKLVRVYEQATVVDNKLEEGGGNGLNPALELSISKGNEPAVRDVIYALHEGFSLNPQGVFGLKFRYLPSQEKLANDAVSSPGAVKSSAESIPAGHFVQVNLSQDNQVAITLFKNQEKVGEKVLHPGENITTPWMGMVITLKDIAQDDSTLSSVSSNAISSSGFEPSLTLGSTRYNNQGEQVSLSLGRPLKVVIGDKAYSMVFEDVGMSLPFTLLLDENNQIAISQEGHKQTLENIVGKSTSLGLWKILVTSSEAALAIIQVSWLATVWLSSLGALLCFAGLILGVWVYKKN